MDVPFAVGNIATEIVRDAHGEVISIDEGD